MGMLSHNSVSHSCWCIWCNEVISSCASRQAGRWGDLRVVVPVVPLPVPSSAQCAGAGVVETICLGGSGALLCHWGGVVQGQPDPILQRAGVEVPEGAGLVLCCAPILDQSPTREVIPAGRPCSCLCEVNGKVGNGHPQKLQKPGHPPAPPDCHGPHGLPAHSPCDSVSPCAYPLPSTTNT